MKYKGSSLWQKRERIWNNSEKLRFVKSTLFSPRRGPRSEPATWQIAVGARWQTTWEEPPTCATCDTCHPDFTGKYSDCGNDSCTKLYGKVEKQWRWSEKNQERGSTKACWCPSSVHWHHAKQPWKVDLLVGGETKLRNGGHVGVGVRRIG